MNYTVIETLNDVEVVLREDGKYGVNDLATGQIEFRYRTETMARDVAEMMSRENARIDAHERAHQG